MAGRFTTRDTIGIWGDDDNLGNGYAYVGNNSASAMDPGGENVINTTRSNIKHDPRKLVVSGGGPGFFDVYNELLAPGGNAGSTRTGINTTRSNIKHQGIAIEDPGIKYAPGDSLGFFDTEIPGYAMFASAAGGSSCSTRGTEP